MAEEKNKAEALAQREKDYAKLGRSCPNSDTCVFADDIAAGGDPCRNCKHLTKGDSLITEM